MSTFYRRFVPGLVAVATATFFFALTKPVTEARVEGKRELKPMHLETAGTVRIDSIANQPAIVPTPSTTSRAVPPVVILHGSRNLKVIALTFDACTTVQPSRYDERITNVLLETGTPATLFLSGRWMEEEPEHTKHLAAHPQFELANHTLSHPHLSQVADESIRYELLRTQEILESLTGKRATLFRPPFGEYDDRVVHIAAKMGLTTVQFDLASGDPDPTFTKERLVRYVASMARNGAIIVMHINGRGWHTAEALPAIIARLRERGFTFVTVSEMLAIPSSGADKKERARE